MAVERDTRDTGLLGHGTDRRSRRSDGRVEPHRSLCDSLPRPLDERSAFAVGALVRPHVHTREDEISIVLEGEIGFRSEDQEAVLRPGGYIIKPRDQVHAMWNAGSTPARMIEIISPAGFEGFFRGFADLNDAGPINPPDVAALAEQYGLPYAQPDWLTDVIERYGLTPPPMTT